MQAIAQFISDVFAIIGQFFDWMLWLAERLNGFSFEVDGVRLAMGMYRYLVGDTVYMLQVTIVYVGALMLAVKVIPSILALWKKFSPIN